METTSIQNLVLTKFYSINHTLSTTGSSNTRNDRSSWAIVYKYDGETSYKTKKQTVVANNSQIAILPKGSTYRWKCIKTGHYFILEFDCNYCSKDLYVCKIKNPNLIFEIFENIMNEKMKINSFSSLKIFQLLYELLYVLFESNSEKTEQNSKHEIIMPALVYMNTNLKKKITNDELASTCNLSTSYFRRIFTEALNEPPLKYLINLRIKRAKELLRSDFTSVTEIAREVGYDDIYHFSKLFKQKTGISPLNFIKNKK